MSNNSLVVRLKKWRKSLSPNNPVYKFSLVLLKWRFFFIYKTKAIKEYFRTVPRRLGHKDPRYEALLKLKGAYEGKRCFIACTGPSLTIEDLEKLGNEYVFGMNSICMIHNKTDWKPDFFAIQDVNVYERVKDTLLSTDNGLCFAPYGYKKRFNTPDDWVYFPICGSYHLYELKYKNTFFSRFSKNPYVTVYDGYTVTYSIIQLAVYMGFKEIYLIGCDCNYMGKQQHFIEHGHMEMHADTATQRMSSAYETARRKTEELGVHIYNATRGGCLEVYPRIHLEDVLSNNNNNKNNKLHI